jgi:hypothetical protein
MLDAWGSFRTPPEPDTPRSPPLTSCRFGRVQRGVEKCSWGYRGSTYARSRRERGSSSDEGALFPVALNRAIESILGAFDARTSSRRVRECRRGLVEIRSLHL